LLQVRNELTSATKLVGRVVPNAPQSPAADTPEYAYQYDDIGNRITSTDLGTNRTYTANSLNQYTLVGRAVPGAPQGEVEEFVPQFDDDGNQTLIQTSTGIWQVQYNGENRPVLWTGGTQSAATNIVMSFDRMGRRVRYLDVYTSITNCNLSFTYDKYICILRFCYIRDNSCSNYLALAWDPTEPFITQPIVSELDNSIHRFCLFDGNKNISTIADESAIVFENVRYSPFGKVVANDEESRTTPFGFSSEYLDTGLGIVYYNFRHYIPELGRWMQRDPMHFGSLANKYSFVGNMVLSVVDELGLDIDAQRKMCDAARSAIPNDVYIKKMLKYLKKHDCKFSVKCVCCNPDDVKKGNLGSYSPADSWGQKGDVRICINAGERNESEYSLTMVHEVIHVLDYCRLRTNKPTCNQTACTEIRAYSNDGGCNPNGSNWIPADKSKYDCVRRQAFKSCKNMGGCLNLNDDEKLRDIIRYEYEIRKCFERVDLR
jgi:RHS repeat-associated protein